MAVKKLCTFGGILGVLLLGSTAFGQPAYVGDQTCGVCHEDIFDTYMLTGHPWKVVFTGGSNPPEFDNNGFMAFPHDVELPEGVDWTQVNYLFGHFHSGATGGAGRTVDLDGNQAYGNYGGCVKCHVTGYNPDGGPTNGVTGSWLREGIRCEECHGLGGDHVASFGVTPPPGDAHNSCLRCHYAGADVDNIEFHVDEFFGSSHIHHPQAEQVLASPHFRRGQLKCHYCHDVHKSTFFEEEGGQDRHCTECHDAAEHSLPAGMAWMDCKDCHMPQGSHLFKITTEPITAAENMHDVAENGRGFLNKDEEGKSFMTLDQVCLGCHTGEAGGRALTLQEAAEAAESMHGYRELLADVVVDSAGATGHHENTFQITTQDDQVTVDLSLWPGGSNGVPADWFIVASTDWGWYYWDPTLGWQPGLVPSLVDFDVFEVDPAYNVFDGTLFPGYYTFWFGVFTEDGVTTVDSSSIYVLP